MLLVHCSTSLFDLFDLYLSWFTQHFFNQPIDHFKVQQNIVQAIESNGQLIDEIIRSFSDQLPVRVHVAVEPVDPVSFSISVAEFLDVVD